MQLKISGRCVAQLSTLSPVFLSMMFCKLQKPRQFPETLAATQHAVKLCLEPSVAADSSEELFGSSFSARSNTVHRHNRRLFGEKAKGEKRKESMWRSFCHTTSLCQWAAEWIHTARGSIFIPFRTHPTTDQTLWNTTQQNNLITTRFNLTQREKENEPAALSTQSRIMYVFTPILLLVSLKTFVGKHY